MSQQAAVRCTIAQFAICAGLHRDKLPMNCLQVVLSVLQDAGYDQTHQMTGADVVLVNTCAIREGEAQQLQTASMAAATTCHMIRLRVAEFQPYLPC